MKTFFSEFRNAILATLVLVFVCCGIYPLIVFAVGQTFFRDNANGSLIVDKNGTVRGSALIGQNFIGEKYFHPRPSAAGANGYDGTSSGGSNLGPTSKKLYDAIEERAVAYRKENGLADDVEIPADAVTASASGLDPHISLRNAELQISRVARARGLKEEKIRELIRQNTENRAQRFFGQPGVNVLKLNRALDELSWNSKKGEHARLGRCWMRPRVQLLPRVISSEIIGEIYALGVFRKSIEKRFTIWKWRAQLWVARARPTAPEADALPISTEPFCFCVYFFPFQK